MHGVQAGFFLQFLTLLVFLVVSGSWGTASVGAATWDVPTAVSTIQAAIDSAAERDTVAVFPGLYHERLALTGKNIVLRGVAGPDSTFLSGAGLAGDSLSILTLSWVDSTTLITGFTFEDNGADSAWWTYGGAIAVDGNPIISGNVFQRNYADVGSAICCSFGGGGRAQVLRNTFIDNTAHTGGAIGLFLSDPIIVAGGGRGHRGRPRLVRPDLDI